MDEKPEIVAHATGPECQEMQEFLDELNALDIMLQKTVNIILTGQISTRQKMRKYWGRIREIYALDSVFNYNMNHLTGDIYKTGLAIKPDKPK